MTEDNVEFWLAAGAFGVGWVNCLFVEDDLVAVRFDVFRARAQRMVGKVHGARKA